MIKFVKFSKKGKEELTYMFDDEDMSAYEFLLNVDRMMVALEYTKKSIGSAHLELAIDHKDNQQYTNIPPSEL